MDSVVQPGLSPALVSGIKEALTCGLIGLVVATGVYGITILQAYMYFRNNGHDSIYLRSFVASLFILDTISMVLTVNIFYEYFITDFGDQSLLLCIPWSFAYENALTVLIGTLTQCFFAHRLWALSKRNIMVVSSIVIMALGSFGPGMVISVNLHTHGDIFYLGSLETRILAGFANGLSVICDIVIAAALSYYLHHKRTGFKRTDSKIDRLIIYSINRGALTAMCQAGHMITIVALPGHFIFFVFGLLDGKLYCNTLLATLNAQKSMSREGDNVVELGTQVFNRSDLGNRNHPSNPTFVVDITTEKTVDVVRTLSIDHND
ncbi:hypothetical protein LXA43DRAFT_1187399 [Ganoderma leucocontextum]|nr:hypothetical protein LXA43DRAFT_1187399 [Ganoderma leucocontextum]